MTNTEITAAPVPKNSIIFHAPMGGAEMFRVSPDGFYVHGVKIEQDTDEATAVYAAFIAWLKTTGFYK